MQVLSELPNSQNAGDENSCDDRSLLRQYRDGESDAATELYLRYAERLQVLTSRETSKNLAPRFDSEDVVQSVFRTFFRRVSEGMYNVPPGEELWNLLLVLALNKIRTLGRHHRAKKRDVRTTTSIAESTVTNSFEESSYRVLRMAIDEMLQGIPESKRTIIELRIQGNSINDIAANTGRSKRTIERIIQQFKARLSQVIDDE